MFTLFSEKWERILFVIIVITTVIFLWYPYYLPMLDLPQHASQITLLNDLLKGKSPWSHLVQLNWDTPYLTIYLTWLLIFQFTHAITASKLIIIIIFLFYLFSFRLLRKSFNAPRLVDWGALTCFFGFAFQYGLISYLGAIPIGILFFLANKKALEQPKLHYYINIFILGTLTYFSHILIFSFFCFLSYLYFLSTHKKNIIWKDFLIFHMLYIFFIGIFTRYILKPSLFEFKYYNADIIYPSFWQKTFELLYLPWNMVPLDYYDLAFIAMLILPPLMGFKLQKKIELFCLLLGFFLIWYILPDKAFQTGFVYQRFAIFFIPFYYLIWQKSSNLSYLYQSISQVSSLIFILCISALMFKVWNNNIKFNHAPATLEFISIIDKMQAGKRILSLFEPHLRGSGTLTSDLEYLYFANWYQVEKQGWADFNFAAFHPQIVRFKANKIPANYGKNRGIDVDNLTQNIRCTDYDYLLMRTHENAQTIQNYLNQNPYCQNFKLHIQTSEWLVFSNK